MGQKKTDNTNRGRIMKIFYGVQGTGNGHITRARVMAKELHKARISTDFMFTGRPIDKYFDMEIFGDYKTKTGLTFAIHKGQVEYFNTAIQSHPITFIKDIKELDLSGYDFVISDYEPITSWAAKVKDIPVLGIGHQYAFNHKIPLTGSDPLARMVMKNFAPVTVGVGLHWYHFNQPILPPIIDIHVPPLHHMIKNKVIVYLPFEDQQEVIKLLMPYTEFDFHVYSPEPVISPYKHITFNLPSRNGFQKDLYDSSGVLCNAGFELVSEALQMGKKLLVKPVHAQMEQLSNALALTELGYGQAMYNLDDTTLSGWLYRGKNIMVSYPNVAKHLVEWIQDGLPTMTQDYIDWIWEGVDVTVLDLFE